MWEISPVRQPDRSRVLYFKALYGILNGERTQKRLRLFLRGVIIYTAFGRLYRFVETVAEHVQSFPGHVFAEHAKRSFYVGYPAAQFVKRLHGDEYEIDEKTTSELKELIAKSWRISGFAIAAFTLACTKDGVVVKIKLQPEPIASSSLSSTLSCVPPS